MILVCLHNQVMAIPEAASRRRQASRTAEHNTITHRYGHPCQTAPMRLLVSGGQRNGLVLT